MNLIESLGHPLGQLSHLTSPTTHSTHHHTPPHTTTPQVLQEMGYHCRPEQVIAKGLFSVDILLRHPGGALVVVEVDGPFHYAANETSRPLGEWHLLGVMGGLERIGLLPLAVNPYAS
jgi:hypothetical protein